MTTENPYHPPLEPTAAPFGETGTVARPVATKSVGLLLLACLLVLRFLVSSAILAIGVLAENPALFFQGLASCLLFAAIFVGLLRAREWARILELSRPPLEG